MAIDWPDTIIPASATPFLRDFGGVLTPFLGGPEQRINRLGMRLGLRVTLPPMSFEVARVAVSRLMQGKAQRMVMKWPLAGFTPGSPGTPLVRVLVNSGTTLQIKGLSASYAFREGQPISVVAGGRRYVHLIVASASANGSGDTTVSVWPPIRAAFSVNDVVEIATPRIEGHVLPGDELSWQIGVDRAWSMDFNLVEAA